MPDEPQKLPPLRPIISPMVPIDTLVTVGKITLAAGDIPRGILKQFYTHTLGLTFVDANDNLVHSAITSEKSTSTANASTSAVPPS